MRRNGRGAKLGHKLRSGSCAVAVERFDIGCNKTIRPMLPPGGSNIGQNPAKCPVFSSYAVALVPPRRWRLTLGIRRGE